MNTAEQKKFLQKYGPWACITGAAQGIGAAFAQQLAAWKMNVVLIDNNRDGLEEQEALITSKHKVQVRSIVIDLSNENCIWEIAAETEDIQIGLLINNAAVSKIGAFLSQDLGFLYQQLQVNSTATLLLTHFFGQQMVERQKGGVIIMSSFAAVCGAANNANYAATKAYNRIFAESLWAEWKDKGVDVLGFMPWKTDTPGYRKEAKKKQKDELTAEETAEKALLLLGTTPSASIGFKAKLTEWMMAFFPRKWLINKIGQELKENFKVEG